MPESPEGQASSPASASSTSTPSTPPGPPKSALQSALETVVDLVAIGGVIYLAAHGKIDGLYALVAIGLLGGIRVSDLVALRAGKGPTGGAAGLIVALASTLLHRPGGGAS